MGADAGHEVADIEMAAVLLEKPFGVEIPDTDVFRLAVEIRRAKAVRPDQDRSGRSRQSRPSH